MKICKNCGLEKTGIDFSRNGSRYCKLCKYRMKIEIRSGKRLAGFNSRTFSHADKIIMREYLKDISKIIKMESIWENRHRAVLNFHSNKNRSGQGKRLWKERSLKFGKWFIKRSSRKKIWRCVSKSLRIKNYGGKKRAIPKTIVSFPPLVLYFIETIREKIDANQLRPFPISKIKVVQNTK